MTANRPYDPELADPTSDIFQNYSMDFKKAVSNDMHSKAMHILLTFVVVLVCVCLSVCVFDGNKQRK